MNNMTVQILKDMGTTLVAVAPVVTGIVWIGKGIFQQIISRDLEKYKNNLEKEAMHFKIRYEKMQGERVEVIRDLYGKIFSVHNKLLSLTSLFQGVNEQSQKDKLKLAGEQFDNLKYNFNKNRIFFDKSLADRIDKLLELFGFVLIDMDESLFYKEYDSIKEYRDKWLKTWKKIERGTPVIKSEIENEFRSLLGVGVGNEKN